MPRLANHRGTGVSPAFLLSALNNINAGKMPAPQEHTPLVPPRLRVSVVQCLSAPLTRRTSSKLHCRTSISPFASRLSVFGGM